MKNKVTVVYAIHWRNEMDEYGYINTRYSKKIRKIFNNLDDALAYINSIENQKAPEVAYDSTIENDGLSGFYLEQEQFEVE